MVTRVVLNSPGVRQMLASFEMRNEIARRAASVVRAAGPGHKAEVQRGKDRVRAAIWTATDAARKAEAEDHNLLRALDAARR